MKNTVTKTIPQILKDNICTIFNLLNILIALSLAFVGAWKNMLFIMIIIINTVVGIVQEIKAKKQIEKLTLLSLPTVKIIRNNREKSISPDEVLKNDILLLESGCVVCSDSLITEGSVEVNESILTGESEPVVKNYGDELLSGSTIISGKCKAEVIHSYNENFTSKIVDEVKRSKQSSSELLSSMKKVTKFTCFLIIPLGILMFLQGYFFRDSSITNAVVSTSAGLLGMLPKGLVLLISIGLAAGVISLSKKNVLVRDLHSLENLAHCDVLCIDKTGTLTEGKISVDNVIMQSDADKEMFLNMMGAYLHNTSDNNATYLALKDYFKENDNIEVLSEIPFSSTRKWSAVTLSEEKAFVLGAPEKLCGKFIPEFLKKELSSGKRAIVAGLTEKIQNNTIDCDKITLLAAIIMTDPIRENAKDTINYFYKQGVEVKMISGDNPVTASSIANKAGIKNADKFIDMSDVTDNGYTKITEKYNIFGRTTPQQKKLLIAAMQKNNHNVAMTGDGVNDLLAMRQSNCSIAVGCGSDAAKQTAQIVLLNSDFAVLRDVISEGRRVINNITKSAGVFFIKTIYSVLITVLCLIFNFDFPFIPIQITLIDAIIEGFPAFFMSFEKNDEIIKGSFLSLALRSALPNGISVAICCLAAFVLFPRFGLERSQLSLLLYLTVGFVSLAGVIKASLPFNIFRGFLAISSCIGFIACVIMFAPMLQLPSLSAVGMYILPFLLIFGVCMAVFIKVPKFKNIRI